MQRVFPLVLANRRYKKLGRRGRKAMHLSASSLYRDAFPLWHLPSPLFVPLALVMTVTSCCCSRWVVVCLTIPFGSSNIFVTTSLCSKVFSFELPGLGSTFLNGSQQSGRAEIRTYIKLCQSPHVPSTLLHTWRLKCFCGSWEAKEVIRHNNKEKCSI